jgi:uncharacterized protein YdeI (BOF family)
MFSALALSLPSLTPQSAPAQTVATAAAPTNSIMAVRDAKARELLNQEVLIRGTISNYRTPTSDRAPHKMELRDETGSIQIAVWNDVWTQIPFNVKLQTKDNVKVTARVKLRLFRNEVEGHIGSAFDIVEGDAVPAVVGPINWITSISEAISRARAAQQPIIVFFASPTGETSNFVETNIFGDKRVREALATRFIPVRIDISQQPEVAQKLQVYRGGVVNIYGPDAAFRKSHPNLRRPEELLRDLQQ